VAVGAGGLPLAGFRVTAKSGSSTMARGQFKFNPIALTIKLNPSDLAIAALLRGEPDRARPFNSLKITLAPTITLSGHPRAEPVEIRGW
jgi:hypothetical protein